MDELTFEWDPAKADSNLTKHGISFDEASTVRTRWRRSFRNRVGTVARIVRS